MENWATAAKIKHIRISDTCDQFQVFVTLDEVEDFQSEPTEILVRSVLRLHSLNFYLFSSAPFNDLF